MSYNKLTLLELLALAKDPSTSNYRLKKCLEDKANNTLKRLFKNHQSAGANQVLEFLRNEGRHADHDSAVKCFDALTFLKEDLEKEIKQSQMTSAYWRRAVLNLSHFNEKYFQDAHVPKVLLDQFKNDMFEVISNLYPGTSESDMFQRVMDVERSVSELIHKKRCHICTTPIPQPLSDCSFADDLTDVF